MLIGLGLTSLWRSRSRVTPEVQRGDARTTVRVYLQFLGLTLLNPLTIVYFAALVLGGSLESGWSMAGGALFVLGAGLASLSWQSLLAGLGAQLGKHLSPRARLATVVAGNLVVVALGARILWRVIGGG